MASKRPARNGGRSSAFAPGSGASKSSGSKPPKADARSQAIPETVANRMARRIALATGTPTILGMGVFVASYLLVSREILEIPTGVTLVGSGAFFLLGLVGLSYGVFSSSWEESPGSLLGGEQIGMNIKRLRESLRQTRSGGNER